MTIAERRSAERIPIDCQVGYFHLPPSLNTPVFHTLNLSMAGACIEAPSSFVQGASLSFYIITPDHQVADVHAQVVHTKLVNPDLYHVGVRFTHLAERDRAVLNRTFEMVRLAVG